MIVRSLKIENYRNYDALNLEFHPGTNIFYGDNAQGKTNALEAIYVCATSRSHRGTKDREIIQFDKEEAHIRMIVEKKGVPYRIDMHLKKGRSKGVAVNGVPIRRVTELFGILNVIFFSPEDLSIIKESPAERRRFMDMELCQLDPIYTSDLTNYNKVVTQRNRLLKDIYDQPELMDTLSVWDEQMIRYGENVIRRREEFIRELNDIIVEVHRNLTGGREEIKVTYQPNVRADQMAVEMRKGQRRDLAAKVSLTGPHRDDIQFDIQGVDVRHFGSQGQQRTAALSLKLAEIELVKRRTGDRPVLLLDDVLSELDTNRQIHLLKSIEEIQTMITCTGLDDFVHHCFHIDQKFHVENGSVITEVSEETNPQ